MGLKVGKRALNRRKTTFSEAQQQQDKQGFLMFFNQNKFKKHKNQKTSLIFDESKNFYERTFYNSIARFIKHIYDICLVWAFKI